MTERNSNNDNNITSTIKAEICVYFVGRTDQQKSVPMKIYLQKFILILNKNILIQMHLYLYLNKCM